MYIYIYIYVYGMTYIYIYIIDLFKLNMLIACLKPHLHPGYLRMDCPTSRARSQYSKAMDSWSLIPVIIHFWLGFSLTKTLQLLGDPQSILLTIYEGFLNFFGIPKMDGLQWKIPNQYYSPSILVPAWQWKPSCIFVIEKKTRTSEQWPQNPATSFHLILVGL